MILQQINHDYLNVNVFRIFVVNNLNLKLNNISKANFISALSPISTIVLLIISLEKKKNSLFDKFCRHFEIVLRVSSREQFQIEAIFR